LTTKSRGDCAHHGLHLAAVPHGIQRGGTMRLPIVARIICLGTNTLQHSVYVELGSFCAQVQQPPSSLWEYIFGSGLVTLAPASCIRPVARRYWRRKYCSFSLSAVGVNKVLERQHHSKPVVQQSSPKAIRDLMHVPRGSLGIFTG
jgi:hypothetical protein